MDKFIQVSYCAFTHNCKLKISSLPEKEDADPVHLSIDKDVESFLDKDAMKETFAVIVAGQFRTRLRGEPILRELLEELKSFDVQDD
jgi:hypothetical protein